MSLPAGGAGGLRVALSLPPLRGGGGGPGGGGRGAGGGRAVGGGLDDVQVVLDHHHGVAGRDQPVEHRQQLPDVVEVQARGGLVEDVERAAGGALGELARELDALGLAARERGRGLAQGDVAQAHVGRVSSTRRIWGWSLKSSSASSTVMSSTSAIEILLVLHRQGGVVEALALADLAGHVDVGQEVHLDLLDPVALAGLAAPALDVEREAPGRVAVHARVGQQREEVADQVEELGVGGRVAARRAADRALVDVDDLVDVLQPLDALVPADRQVAAVQAARHGRVEDLVDERALAGPRGARDGHEQAQRELGVDVLEVVLAGAHHAHGRARRPGGAPSGSRCAARP